MNCAWIDEILSFVRDNAALVKIVVAAIGGAFAFWKWRADVSAKRSIQFRKLIDDFQNDEKVKQLLYTLDDDEIEWFSNEFVGDADKGPVLDKLLFQICYVIYLYKKCKFITKDEFLTLSYMVDRPLLNPQLQDYLYNLKMYAEGKGLQHPFKYLVDYGVENGFLDESMFEETKPLKKKKAMLKYNELYKEWLASEVDYAKRNYSYVETEGKNDI